MSLNSLDEFHSRILRLLSGRNRRIDAFFFFQAAGTASSSVVFQLQKKQFRQLMASDLCSPSYVSPFEFKFFEQLLDRSQESDIERHFAGVHLPVRQHNDQLRAVLVNERESMSVN